MSDTVELLQALIRNECVNDGSTISGFESRSVGTLVDYFGRAGEAFEIAPGRTSMAYRLEGHDPSSPALMLMGHTDVVPVNVEGWSRDPFGAEIDDGFIWGRGAIDMLNLVASMAVVFKPLLRGNGKAPSGDLVFLAVADEEAGGGLGASPLVADRWDLVSCDYLLSEIAYPPVMTSGGLGFPIAVGEKGPHWTVLESTGTPGHGSVTYRSDNALEPMVAALHGLFTTASPAVITDEWKAQVDAMGLAPDLAAALTNVDEVDAAIDVLAASDPRWAAYLHACTHMTVSPNVVTGGVKTNMVPDAARAQVDVRTLPGQGRSDVDRFLEKAMGAAADHVTLTPTADHPANASNRTDPLWETIVDSIEAETGTRRVIPTMMPATTDARFFRTRGVAAYGVGLFDQRVSFPDFLSMFHGNDERVSIDSVESTTRLMQTIVDRWIEKTAR